jgi:hypothetical protein
LIKGGKHLPKKTSKNVLDHSESFLIDTPFRVRVGNDGLVRVFQDKGDRISLWALGPEEEISKKASLLTRLRSFFSEFF